jgi:alpha-tubulin suppressor-like RCC1 family protein
LDCFSPQPITALSGVAVRQVACGDAHTLVATEAGELYAFGRNQNGGAL